MLKLYGRLAGRAAHLAVRGWPAAVALLLYATLLQLATGLSMQLGRLGGVVLVFVVAFLISSYLHLVSLVVADRRIHIGDFRESFRPRFWDVVMVLFAIWVIQLLVGVVTIDWGQRGQIVAVLVGLTMVVFFNAIPELIYMAQGRVRSFGLLMTSARFITRYWPEWLGPTAIIGAVMLAPLGVLQQGSAAERLLRFQGLFSVNGIAAVVLSMPLWLAPLMLLFITWAMVFRGLLFAALASGAARKRSWP
ncbi:MAG TPA: hypothetical protein VMT03_11880 [Polyangia bacterium]|nr:hypothetical protein [Polyangia bacterium]